MESAPGPQSVGGGTTLARAIVLLLAVIFVVGALAQFFLAGLSIFDSPSHWSDHETVGHIIGEAAFVAWIPAALGRSGVRLIAGTVLLTLLMTAQYAFVNAGAASIQALHALNGALLFALSLWIAVASLRLLLGARQPTGDARA